MPGTSIYTQVNCHYFNFTSVQKINKYTLSQQIYKSVCISGDPYPFENNTF